MPKSTRKPRVPSLRKVRKIAESDPLAAVHAAGERLEKRESDHVRDLYESLAIAYRAAHDINASTARMSAFVADPFWSQSKRKRPTRRDSLEDTLYFVVRLLFRAPDTNSPRYNRAYKYHRILQAYRKENLSTEEIVDRLLSDEGVEKAYNVAAANERNEGSSDAVQPLESNVAAAKTAQPDPKVKTRDGRTKKDTTQNSGDVGGSTKREASGNGRSRSSRGGKMTVDLGSHLYIIDSEEIRRQAFALPFGGKGLLTIKRLKNGPGNFVQLKATRFKPAA